MRKTKIEWAEMVWNPVTGCTKISQGCDNCYAERMSKRLRGRVNYPQAEPFAVTLHPDRLIQPAKKKKPTIVFVCSMSDLFHVKVGFPFVEKVFEAMAAAPQHTYLILTKRPHILKLYLQWTSLKPTNNMWFGVSAEDQATASYRISQLLDTDVENRFVSLEPLLEKVCLTKIYDGLDLKGSVNCLDDNMHENFDIRRPTPSPKIKWVIMGGESGPGARAMPLTAVRIIVDECKRNNTPLYFKQWGEWMPVDEYFKRDFQSTLPPWQSLKTQMYTRDNINVFAVKAGKKVAGNSIDGKQYEEFPWNY